MYLYRGKIRFADAVLAMVEYELGHSEDEPETSLHLEMYANGREQGYCIRRYRDLKMIAVSFSENRNSDDIVVYDGPGVQFSMQGNVPDEATYLASRRYFPYNKLQDAVDHIMSLLVPKAP